MDPPLSQHHHQQQQHYLDDQQYPQYAVPTSYLPDDPHRKYQDYPHDTDPQIYENHQQQYQPQNDQQPNNHHYDPGYDRQLQMEVQMHQQHQQQQQHFIQQQLQQQQNYTQDWEQQQYAEYNDPMYQQQMMMQQQPFPMAEGMGVYNQNPNYEQFVPPASVTPEELEKYREDAKQSNDPQVQLEFAKFLVDTASMAPDSVPGDAKASKKYRDGLLAEGIKLIKRLASQGMGLSRPAYPEAQFFLANCYGTGALGLPVDHDKAFSLYVQASKQSHPAATYRTSVCYEVGAGTKRDHGRATQFYRKAAALGDTAAMYKLGMILLNGLLGQQKNPREAITWLKRASAVADEENPHALHQLGLCYESAGIPNLIPDEAYSRELFAQAAQLGYAPSQFKMGCCYEYGTLTCPVDPRRSIAWYTRAAEQGDSESELALSGWYLTGSEGVLKQSDTEAYLWARKAADKGLAKAEYAVGYYSEVGIGVKMDLDEARRWYMRAAAQGNKRAMQRLTDLKRLGNASRKAKPEKHTRGKDGDCTIC